MFIIWEMIKEGEVDAMDFLIAVWEDGALEEVVVEPLISKHVQRPSLS